MRAGRRRRAPTASRIAGNAVLRGWCRDITGNVLSVGSGSDSDHEGASYRSYFRRATYRTSDIGLGADLILDVRAVGDMAGRFDAVFAHSVLEHVDDVFAGARGCAALLRPGGFLIVSVPFQYGIHRAPRDYWRFTEHGLVYLLHEVAGLDVEEIVGVDGPPKAPACYLARARRAA